MSWLKKLFGGREDHVPEPIRVELPPADGEAIVRRDQLLRKEWADDLLRADGVPVNPHLPMIESEAEVRLRTKREVADRLRALVIVAFKGSENPDQDLIDSIVAERRLRELFTPDELAFIEKPNRMNGHAFNSAGAANPPGCSCGRLAI